MHFRDQGAARGLEVLLIHGQLLDGSIWDALSAGLARTRRVLPSLNGFDYLALRATAESVERFLS